MNRLSFVLALALGAVITTAVPSSAQTATEAQKSALRSHCAHNFRTYCKGVPAGGAPAVECLNKNMASLSSACQTAVKAVIPQ